MLFQILKQIRKKNAMNWGNACKTEVMHEVIPDKVSPDWSALWFLYNPATNFLLDKQQCYINAGILKQQQQQQICYTLLFSLSPRYKHYRYTVIECSLSDQILFSWLSIISTAAVYVASLNTSVSLLIWETDHYATISTLS